MTADAGAKRGRGFDKLYRNTENKGHQKALSMFDTKICCISQNAYDLDQIIEEDSKNQRLAVACIREFLLSIQK